jgi:hypothetical protein
MKGTRLGQPVRAAKRVELDGSTIRTTNASDDFPAFEERIRLTPAGPGGTEVLWSGCIRPGKTLEGRLRARWARRMLTRDAERCLSVLTERAIGASAAQVFSNTAT